MQNKIVKPKKDEIRQALENLIYEASVCMNTQEERAETAKALRKINQHIKENYIHKDKVLGREEVDKIINDSVVRYTVRSKNECCVDIPYLTKSLLSAGSILKDITAEDELLILRNMGIEIEELGQFYRIEKKSWIPKISFKKAIYDTLGGKK